MEKGKKSKVKIGEDYLEVGHHGSPVTVYLMPCPRYGCVTRVVLAMGWWIKLGLSRHKYTCNTCPSCPLLNNGWNTNMANIATENH